MENNYYYNEDDELVVILPPYYRVTYIDDEGRKHIATVKDTLYLQYLKDRFIVEECIPVVG